MTSNSLTPTEKALNIPELLEQILIEHAESVLREHQIWGRVDTPVTRAMKRLFEVQQTLKCFQGTITGSPKLQRFMFLRPQQELRDGAGRLLFHNINPILGRGQLEGQHESHNELYDVRMAFRSTADQNFIYLNCDVHFRASSPERTFSEHRFSNEPWSRMLVSRDGRHLTVHFHLYDMEGGPRLLHLWCSVRLLDRTMQELMRAMWVAWEYARPVYKQKQTNPGLFANIAQ